VDVNPDAPPAAPPHPLVADAATVRAHQAAIWRYLRVLGASADTADDLVQETFVALLRSQLVDRGEGALRTWLRGTARNLFLEQCRRERRTPVALDAAAVDAALSAYERDDDGAGYRAALMQCLATLPDRQRELLQLASDDAVDGRRLAGSAGQTVEGARSLLRRLKQALRECVQRRLRDGR
jgi:RNA polymerase sigma-70 factor (ECF subfamily)